MAPQRPPATVIAVLLLEIVAVLALGFGISVFAIGGDLVGGVPFGLTITAIGAVAVAFGAVAVAGVIGVWRGRAWGWVAALVVAVTGLLGLAGAGVGGPVEMQLLVGILLFGVLLACLLTPGLRRRSGVG